MFKGTKLQIESDDSIERYIVPLDAIIETKSCKDLMEKEEIKYKKSTRRLSEKNLIN